MPQASAAHSPPRLRVAARGWEHPHWLRGFYPDDLPADWRLGYYANEASAVLVPAAEARRRLAEEGGDWAEELQGEFRLLLEWPQGPAPDAAEWALLGALGERFGGFWLDAPWSGWEALQASGPVWLPLSVAAEAVEGARLWAPLEADPPRDAGLPVAGLRMSGFDGDLRALRGRLEAWLPNLAAAGGERLLVLDEPLPDFALLAQVRVLCELLGLA